jgi:uncharacterized membrane protein (UPF0136 family)
MKISDYFAFFGLVSLVFGILGFVRAKSVPSLVMGGMFGVALVVAAIMAQSHPQRGYILGTVVSVLLLGRFFPAFLKTKRVYPSGIMGGLALLGVGAGVLGLLGH